MESGTFDNVPKNRGQQSSHLTRGLPFTDGFRCVGIHLLARLNGPETEGPPVVGRVSLSHLDTRGGSGASSLLGTVSKEVALLPWTKGEGLHFSLKSGQNSDCGATEDFRQPA